MLTGKASQARQDMPTEKPKPETLSMSLAFGQAGKVSQETGPGRFLARTGVEPGLAFASKFTVHAGTAGQAMSGQEAMETWEKVLAKLSPGPLGLYLHLPFCQNRCLYCGFVGQKPNNELIESYVATAMDEIRFIGSVIPKNHGPVRTIYFGGGTPTIVAPRLLAALAGTIQKTFSLANDFEMTLEGRVSDLSQENVEGFLGAGFNRFSIGIQSFDTKIRRSLGRHSDKQNALACLENLVERKKAPVIIDLIYGLPGQEVESFIGDLATADQAGVDGLDTYQLNVFSGGELERAVKNGRLEAPAKLAAQAEYYLKAAEYLESLNWRRLSLSHYARDTRERNIYNPWAKSRKNCLAIGAGAGGFIEGHATYRQPDVLAYIESGKNNSFGPDFLTLPTGTESMSALIVSQMELGYLNLKQLFEGESVDPAPISVLANNWREAGLARLKGDCLELTDPGRFWGVNLTQALVVTASEARSNTGR
ncbi:MAG: heme anaerobic degradation radical SAM methyltransferase ChuW/HutW [Deltaproteobacteria bacterium]|jgi:oxygen-independent coproporphyrinogen-3 oxidase|nr:heme anaerobic degradation radical SAM methyltransferase ChuW/HutW [Deltaproteobacteria bacterium]